MKREIKFRGLSPLGNWFYGMPCKSNYGVEIVTELYHVDGAEWNVSGQDVQIETVGQFIGLKDKNGKEIYEGDIVKIYNSFYSIEWIDNYALHTICKPKGKAASYPFTDSDRCVIVGNIYENPELLNE